MYKCMSGIADFSKKKSAENVQPDSDYNMMIMINFQVQNCHKKKYSKPCFAFLKYYREKF